jgi:outer membrane protein OmpA-like peptidoglycan-associated protein
MKKHYLTIIAVSFACLCSAQQTTSKFDFIPGEKVIFYDDFSDVSIGDFPLLWLTNGSGEVVTSSDIEGKWLLMTRQGYFIPEVKESFTDNYTIEFDLISHTQVYDQLFDMAIYLLCADASNPQGGAQPGQAGVRIRPANDNIAWNNWSEAREWQGDEGMGSCQFSANQKYHFAFWFQKQRIRLYVNEQKILDLPRGLNAGYTYNIFRMDSQSDEILPMISNFRIAAGLPDMRNKLITEGKLVSYGILFDVNSDKLKPESAPTLKEIAQVLKDNPAVRIKIVGHTDSDGENAANLDLSKRRAASVKAELTNTFGIDAARLESEGKGETEPVAANDSGINKAKNRRVEFIKL